MRPRFSPFFAFAPLQTGHAATATNMAPAICINFLRLMAFILFIILNADRSGKKNFIVNISLA